MDHSFLLSFGLSVAGLAPGQKCFGRFQLRQLIGHGRGSVTWLARDVMVGRELVLKFLPERVAQDPRSVDALKAEALKARDLAHEGIVPIVNFWTDGHLAAVAEGHVSGTSVAKLRQERPGEVFDEADLRGWLGGLCEALAYAHARGPLVHGALRPSKILLTVRGEVKLLDFGVGAAQSDALARLSKLTDFDGISSFLSPQHILGEKPGVLDDVYSLGAILHDLLTGKPPFHGAYIIEQIAESEPEKVNTSRAALEHPAPAVSAAWEGAIAACLSKNPAQRPQSIAELASRLGLPLRLSAPAPLPGTGELPHAAPAEQFQPPSGTPLSRLYQGLLRKGREPKSLFPFYAAVLGLLLLASAAAWYFGMYRRDARRMGVEDPAQVASSAGERALPALKSSKPGLGGVVLRTEPAGASVQIAGVSNPGTPFTHNELAPGSYPVHVHLDGFEDWDGTVEVKKNEFTQLQVVLEPFAGPVSISGLAGAEVFDGEKRLGVLPLTLPKHSLGTVFYTVRAEGYSAVTLSGEVLRNQELKLHAVLKPWQGPTDGKTWVLPQNGMVMMWIMQGYSPFSYDLDGGFWIGRTEVTQSQWSILMPNNPSHFIGGDRPVDSVSWAAAMTYCLRLTAREKAAGRLPEGYEYRLPTMESWEYACRAGSTRQFSGTGVLNTMGWYVDNSDQQTHAVALKQPNGWGLYDMHGNVFEWTWHDVAPVEMESHYVYIMGGSWYHEERACVSNAMIIEESKGNASIGFRVALVPVIKASMKPVLQTPTSR